jgi:hypothetical protein
MQRSPYNIGPLLAKIFRTGFKWYKNVFTSLGRLLFQQTMFTVGLIMSYFLFLELSVSWILKSRQTTDCSMTYRSSIEDR